MLRMPNIQPPTELITIVIAGRSEWVTASVKNAQVGSGPSGKSKTSYPPNIGNHPRPTAKTAMRTSASQKYGMDCRTVVAGMRWSTQVPRFHPAHAPRTTPSRKEMTVAVPTSTSVHGRAPAISSATGVGNLVTDTPRSPRSMRPQYARYCSQRDASSPPSRSLMLRMVVSETSPPARCIFAIMMSAGSPA